MEQEEKKEKSRRAPQKPSAEGQEDEGERGKNGEGDTDNGYQRSGQEQEQGEEAEKDRLPYQRSHGFMESKDSFHIRNLQLRGSAGSLSDLLCHKGEKGNISRSLDGYGKLSLVAGTIPRNSTRHDLAPLRNIATQPSDIFIVDVIDLIRTELANLSPEASLLQHQNLLT